MDVNDFDFPGMLTRIVAAIVILLVTALIAKLVKAILGRQLVKIKPLHRHGDSGQSLGESIATVVSLIVWLFGLVAVLNLFELTSVVTPIQNLLDGLLGALPGVIGAVLIFFVGYILARVVREIVTTSLQAAGADRRLAELQTSAGSTTEAGAGSTDTPADTSSSAATGSSTGSSTPVKISEVAGQVVFALILVVVSISALQVLGIDSISEPATQMLNLILAAIPRIISAAILLAIGYYIGKFVAPLLETTLRGLGTDRALSEVGISSGSTSASAVIARIAHVAIVLFFAVAATRVLGFQEITDILDAVLEIGGQIIFGGAVIAVGVLIANVLAGLASGQAASIVKWTTIGLFVAMGLQFMGLADTIVTLAFGSVVVGAALAAALAFGLGGREVAARQLERLQQRVEDGSATSSTSTTSTSTTSATTPSTTAPASDEPLS